MKHHANSIRSFVSLAAALTVGVAAVLSLIQSSAFAADVKVVLKGEEEVPPVKTPGSGNGFFAIANDKTIADKRKDR